MNDIGRGRAAASRAFPVLAALLLAGPAGADERSGWYAGATFGQAKGELGPNDVRQDLADRGISTSDLSVGDATRNAYRLFAGYRLSPNWSIEAGYTDLGDVSSSGSFGDLTTTSFRDEEVYADVVATAFPVAPAGYEASFSYHHFLSNNLSAAARVGVWRWQNQQTFFLDRQQLASSPNGVDALFGVAFDWSVALNWSIGLEGTRYQTDAQKVDLVAATIRFAW